MATEKFQQIIWQILKDCPGTHNIHDDIRVVGTSEEEHDERLNEVMKKLQESGLTLDYDKCQIGVSSMEYLGNVLTDKGLQVSDDKVKAIVQAPRPKDQSELRSFLGLVQYCARFITWICDKLCTVFSKNIIGNVTAKNYLKESLSSILCLIIQGKGSSWKRFDPEI